MCVFLSHIPVGSSFNCQEFIAPYKCSTAHYGGTGRRGREAIPRDIALASTGADDVQATSRAKLSRKRRASADQSAMIAKMLNLKTKAEVLPLLCGAITVCCGICCPTGRERRVCQFDIS